ncbi:hypothetical protein [Acidocella sp.]|uniref:hypothetical protein n=1 Tax=Acidocella sp. TaxID=50710 RepID=UPI003D01CBDC
MRRLLICATASLALYLVLFGLVLERPLSLRPLWLEMMQKDARLASLPSPKLVILAGSNGPYSHSCAVMGPMLGMACENAGIAVGMGLDEIFIRYAPALHAGDVVYMPMELEQYAMSRAQYRALVDGALMLRHDRAMLRHLPPGRVLGALFCCTLADGLEAIAEMPLAALGVRNGKTILAAEYDVEGDRVDNDLAKADKTLLAGPARVEPSAEEIEAGYGTKLIARFVARERAKGVIVIGGWPTEFSGAKISSATRAAVKRVYGHWFLNLPGQSLYPRRDFFNSEDHLAKPCQFAHSMAVADGLAKMLGRAVNAPGAEMVDVARACS